jgi:class 3 adenylate cyclase
VVFPTVEAALGAAVAIREAADVYTKENRSTPMAIRSGIHFGRVIREAGEFYGHVFFIANRVTSQSKSGEILVTGQAREALSPGAFEFAESRRATLKAIPGEWDLYPLK